MGLFSQVFRSKPVDGFASRTPRAVSTPHGVSDVNVERVRAALLSRMQAGYRKYGTTTERTDVDLLGWLQHLQEELLDAAVYAERLKEEVRLTRLSGETHRG